MDLRITVPNSCAPWRGVWIEITSERAPEDFALAAPHGGAYGLKHVGLGSLARDVLLRPMEGRMD